MPLNDLQCRNAKPRVKNYKLYDADGLYLEVLISGGKYWRYKYRMDGKEKRIALGVYPQITLSEARNLLTEAREQRKSGNDPAMLKNKQKQDEAYHKSQTFELVSLDWFEVNRIKWKPSFYEEKKRRFENHLFPKLGKTPIRQLTTADLYNVLKVVAITAPTTAKRLNQDCSGVFCHAVSTSRAERDITVDLKLPPTTKKKKHFAAIKIDELPDFLKALITTNRMPPIIRLALKILLKTFVRRRELLQAEWTEIDFKNAMWTIPGHRMKMGLEHLVPLSRQTLADLKELYELTGNRKYLLPSITRPDKPLSGSMLLDALDDLGYKGKMTNHGFRALALSIAKERLKYRHEVPDRQLAHVPQNEIVKAYDRAMYLDERIEMMQRYADYIDEQFNPKQTLTQRTINSDRIRTITTTNQPYSVKTSYGIYQPAGSIGYSQYK